MPANTTEVGEDTIFLDNRSVQCAVGIIKLARSLQSLPPGTLVEVWSRDRFAPYEIPIRVNNDGHALLEQEQAGTWPRKYWRFLIQRS